MIHKEKLELGPGLGEFKIDEGNGWQQQCTFYCGTPTDDARICTSNRDVFKGLLHALSLCCSKTIALCCVWMSTRTDRHGWRERVAMKASSVGRRRISTYEMLHPSRINGK